MKRTISLIFSLIFSLTAFSQKQLDNPLEQQRQEQQKEAQRQQAQREKQERAAEEQRKAEIQMIFIEGGTFTMGCTSEQGNDCFNWEKPAHQVTVNGFYIGKYEVTQAQWRAIMGNNSSYFKGDNLPVEVVSWNDIQEFIRKLNAQTGKQYRLPTEAEWEFAARGGNRSQGYKYSGSNTVGNVAWYDGNSGRTHAVGSKSANELGIYDMSGNVWEWCSDWYGDYSSNAQTNPEGPSTGSYRMIRGGSWNTSPMRVSNRFNSMPGDLCNSLGFRLACSSKEGRVENEFCQR